MAATFMLPAGSVWREELIPCPAPPTWVFPVRREDAPSGLAAGEIPDEPVGFVRVRFTLTLVVGHRAFYHLTGSDIRSRRGRA